MNIENKKHSDKIPDYYLKDLFRFKLGYKTKMCNYVDKCSHRNICYFAHSEDELRKEICCHYLLGKRCFVPNASDMMTMIVNDYGIENMYSKFIEYNYTKDSLVILISSSGNSQNIVNANFTASDLGLDIITLTGFDRNNKLSSFSRGILDIWVDSKSYGVVEMAHHSILHSAV
jgi:hypothetical protein